MGETLSAVVTAADDVLWAVDSVAAAGPAKTAPAETASADVTGLCVVVVNDAVANSAEIAPAAIVGDCSAATGEFYPAPTTSVNVPFTFRVREKGQQISSVFHHLPQFTGTRSNFGGLVFRH